MDMNSAIRLLEGAIFPLLPDDLSQVALASRRLSLAFTSERKDLPQDYLDDPVALSAYLAAFLVPNAVKVLHCLAQLEGTCPSSDCGEISLLDIGSGPGAAALAASAFLSAVRPETRLRIAAMERSRPALEKAHELFRRVAPPHHSFESATLDITEQPLDRALAKQRFDICIAANILNELDEGIAHRICSEVIRNFLKENGAFIIIDPALRETARSLMELRDRLVSDGVGFIAAPCLHQRSCPMLSANERDWCHFYIDWEPPEFLKELDRLSGMDHTHLKMSYFILRSSPDPESRVPGPALWRAVSSPLDSKGKREMFLCGTSGELLRMRRTAGDASDSNADFGRVMRGDIVRAPASGRLTKDDSFVVEKEWNSTCAE
jgi:ribosomal protein RSM22 (predicted rRNA methylase)